MKKAFPLLSIFFALNFQYTFAQVTDSIFVIEKIKPYLYSSLPAGTMLDSRGSEVEYVKFIKNDRPFKDRPTLIFTWSNRYCPPCIRLIDSILESSIQKRYNIVLINRDQTKDQKEPIGAISLTRKISDARPTYNQKAVSLFDNENIFERIDEGVTPLLFWLDKDMNIAGALLSYGIKIKEVEGILEKVDNQSIRASKEKYLNSDLMPSLVSEAAYKLMLQDAGSIKTFTWQATSTNDIRYKLNFIKTTEGLYVYDKSSLNVPSVEDMYKEADIIAGVNKMLNSFNENDIKAAKIEKANRNWFHSKSLIKNFTTSVFDDGNIVIFSNSIAYPVRDRRSESKKQEFFHFAKILSKQLAVKPAEEKEKYSDELTYRYVLTKDISVVLKESSTSVFFNIATSRDANGKFPIYNESKTEGNKIESKQDAPLRTGDYFKEIGDEFARIMPQWRYSFTKGGSLYTQHWSKSKEFPVEKISAEWKNDYYITDISYGGAKEKEWLLLTANVKLTDQVWRLKNNTDELKTEIEDLQKKKAGFYISHIAFGENKWALVASKGTGYSGQTTIISSIFPEENIKENYKTDYFITSMAYGAGKWVVVMSKGSSIIKQHFHIWDSWDNEELDEEVEKMDFLTESVKKADKWYMVFSSDKVILKQETISDYPVLGNIIKNKLDQGFSIFRTFFY